MLKCSSTPSPLYTSMQLMSFSSSVKMAGGRDGGTLEPMEIIISSSDEEDYIDDEVLAPVLTAEQLKNEGNAFFNALEFNKAIASYENALAASDEPLMKSVIHANRAACYIQMNRLDAAAQDCLAAISLSPENCRGYVRLIKVRTLQGNFADARKIIEENQGLLAGNTPFETDLATLETIEKHVDCGNKAFERKDYRAAVFHVGQVISHGVVDLRYKVLKAESLLHLDRLEEAHEVANMVLLSDPKHVDGLYVRGVCLYHQDKISHALSHFQLALRLAPDNAKVLTAYKKVRSLNQSKEEATKSFTEGRYEEAYNKYAEALKIDPDNKYHNSRLYGNMATSMYKMGKSNETILDCNRALELDPKYLRILQLRAQSYMQIESYKEAVQDYEAIYNMDTRNKQNATLLQQAKIALKRSQTKDYYKMMGVERNATQEDIKKAYKKLALVHHPDRHSDAPEELRVKQVKYFQEITEAHRVLSDPRTRHQYDNGQDLNDILGEQRHSAPTFFYFSQPFHFE